MYHIKSSFIARKGQFQDNVQEEAIGILVSALAGNEIFEFQIGKEKTVYFADRHTMKQAYGRKQGFVTWINPDKKVLAIFPLSFFHQKDNPQTSLF